MIIPLAYLMGAAAAFPNSVRFNLNGFSGVGGESDIERAVLEAINAEREARGIPALLWDEALARAARQHSWEMKELAYFAHESPLPALKDVTDRVYNAGETALMVGENLAAENNAPADDNPAALGVSINGELMKSAPHRDNILDRRYTHVGVGCSRNDDGTLLCTQVFSKKKISFNNITARELNTKALRIHLRLGLKDEVGVWWGDEVRVFSPDDDGVGVELLLPLSDGKRRMVLARRAVGDFGPMVCFLDRPFDPQKPFSFTNAITEAEVISEELGTADYTFWVIKAEGNILEGADAVVAADGDTRIPVALKGRKLRLEYKIPVRTGIHEVVFVIENEGVHSFKIDTDAVLSEAFMQDGLKDTFVNDDNQRR